MKCRMDAPEITCYPLKISIAQKTGTYLILMRESLPKWKALMLIALLQRLYVVKGLLLLADRWIIS